MLKCTWRNVRDSDTEMEKREFPFFFRREKRKDKGGEGRIEKQNWNKGRRRSVKRRVETPAVVVNQSGNEWKGGIRGSSGWWEERRETKTKGSVSAGWSCAEWKADRTDRRMRAGVKRTRWTLGIRVARVRSWLRAFSLGPCLFSFIFVHPSRRTANKETSSRSWGCLLLSACEFSSKPGRKGRGEERGRKKRKGGKSVERAESASAALRWSG